MSEIFIQVIDEGTRQCKTYYIETETDTSSDVLKAGILPLFLLFWK